MDQPTRRLDTNENATPSEHPTQRMEAMNTDLPFNDTGEACPKCGAERVWADVNIMLPIRLGGVGVNLQFSRKVGDSLLWGPQINTTVCVSLVCSACGFAEFYANKPENLVEEK